MERIGEAEMQRGFVEHGGLVGKRHLSIEGRRRGRRPIVVEIARRPSA